MTLPRVAILRSFPIAIYDILKSSFLLHALCLLAGSFTSAHADTAAELEALIERGQELNYAGDYDGADAVWVQLRTLAPQHPAGATLQASTLYWRQMFDDSDTQYDADIRKWSEEALRLGRARIEVNEADAEAHYYLGASLVDLARLYGFRGSYLKAGSFGEKGRVHLERALVLDPTIVEAKFPLGLYNYYSDFASSVLKLFQWLWFIPKGDAELGRSYLLELAESDSIQRWYASFILANINTYHPPVDYAVAEKLIHPLHERFPDNRLIHSELLELYYESGRFEEAAAEAAKLAERPITNHLTQGRSNVARIWQARALIRLDRPEEAIEVLASMPESGPALPSWGGAWCRVTRAQARDVLGQRKEALDEYREVLALEGGRFDSDRARAIAKAGIEEPFYVTPQVSIGPAPEP